MLCNDLADLSSKLSGGGVWINKKFDYGKREDMLAYNKCYDAGSKKLLLPTAFTISREFTTLGYNWITLTRENWERVPGLAVDDIIIYGGGEIGDLDDYISYLRSKNKIDRTHLTPAREMRELGFKVKFIGYTAEEIYTVQWSRSGVIGYYSEGITRAITTAGTKIYNILSGIQLEHKDMDLTVHVSKRPIAECKRVTEGSSNLFYRQIDNNLYIYYPNLTNPDFGGMVTEMGFGEDMELE